jgi:hypothetical protein
MKKFLLLTTLVLSLGYAAAIVAQFSGLLSFNVFSLPTLIGSSIASGLVALACTDYSRRPRFRVRRTTERPAAPVQAVAFSQQTLWTYATRSSQ